MNKFKRLSRTEMKSVLGGLAEAIGEIGGGSGGDCSETCDSTQHSCECMDVMCVGNKKQYCEKIGTGCKHGTC